MNRKLAVGAFAVLVLLLASAAVFRHSLANFAQTLIGDVKPACEALPNATVVQGRDDQLKSLDTQIVQLTNNGGYAVFDTQRCPGRVELHIFYNSENDKPKLVELWRNSPLGDVPVHWQNV